LNHQQREKLIKDLLGKAEELRIKKGNDYSGMVDVNSNFKRLGERLGLSPMQILWVYLVKHLDAIETFIKDGKVKSEPIEGRIIDAVNYLLILNSLIKETQP